MEFEKAIDKAWEFLKDKLMKTEKWFTFRNTSPLKDNPQNSFGNFTLNGLFGKKK